mmetsp:Transcript_13637/g.27238  ORF Transcript_13637/g.27238 Transcript_13637/m.27238 type:complete len:127 (+) Transcript_13637:788-1168(+)
MPITYECMDMCHFSLWVESQCVLLMNARHVPTFRAPCFESRATSDFSLSVSPVWFHTRTCVSIQSSRAYYIYILRKKDMKRQSNNPCSASRSAAISLARRSFDTSLSFCNGSRSNDDSNGTQCHRA